jgi:hypothetical protein
MPSDHRIIGAKGIPAIVHARSDDPMARSPDDPIFPLSRPAAAFHSNLPVVVAMAAMDMVQVATDQIIDVTPMGDPLVPAIDAVLVVGVMPLA